MEQYTIRSKTNLDKLGRGMSTKEIMEFLEKGFQPRRFSEVLRNVYPGDDLKEKLCGGLIAMESMEQQKEVIDYRVDRWLEKDIVPNSKALDKIFDVLGLNEQSKNRIRLELGAEPKIIRNILNDGYPRGNLEERLRNSYSQKDEKRGRVKAMLDTWSQDCLDENREIIPEWEALISEFCALLNLDGAEETAVLDKIRASRRKFCYILKSEYPGEDLRGSLCAGMYESDITGMKANRKESIRHAVNNWLRDSNIPKREGLFKICFALGLDYSQAEEVIAASGMPIHHRNPDELVFAYGLWNGLSWGKVQVLKEELDERYIPGMRRQRINKYRDEIARLKDEPDAQEEIERCKEKISRLEQELDGDDLHNKVVYSEILREEFFDSADDEKKFFKFYGKRCNEFDSFHETSYREFNKMMDLLQRRYYEVVKEEKWDGAEKMGDTVTAVVKRYFNVPVPAKQRPMMRTIRKNWPSAGVLGAIIRREQDVSREVLIMLSLALDIFEEELPAEGGRMPSDYRQRLSFLPEKTPYERMVSRMDQLKQFLEKCGMNGLDPRNPFDCTVLYAMTATYDCFEETMSDKLKKLMDDSLEG